MAINVLCHYLITFSYNAFKEYLSPREDPSRTGITLISDTVSVDSVSYRTTALSSYKNDFVPGLLMALNKRRMTSSQLHSA